MVKSPEATIMIVNPSADVYGSDLQMLASVRALVQHRWRVVVVITADGPLRFLLERAGAEVVVAHYPVLRRSNATARGLVLLMADLIRSFPRMIKLVRTFSPQVVCVNTLTLPWWLAVGRITGRPVICHVHEAEVNDAFPVRFALQSPVTLASKVIVNSRTTMDTLSRASPWLRSRFELIYNGVEGPPDELEPLREVLAPFVLAVVGRLSPRKGVHVALDCVGNLSRRGRDVRLLVCGTPFNGYEWYETELRARARQKDLAGRVDFLGYVSPIWPVLANVGTVLAPSFGESLGNAVIEAQLAARPVVATAVQGHLETVHHECTGLLVEPGNPVEMADAVERLIDDRGLGRRLGRVSRAQALRSFSTDRYGEEIVAVVSGLVGLPFRRP